jgi:ribosomal protein S18 acetylase RimI-like enzyme
LARQVTPTLIRPTLPGETEQARLLLVDDAWGPRVADSGTFNELVLRSHLALVAMDGPAVIGFLRAIADGMFNGHVSMVVVSESHRGRGVGSALVRHAMGKNRKMTRVLRADRTGVSAFCGKPGFRTSNVAMERPGQR